MIPLLLAATVFAPFPAIAAEKDDPAHHRSSHDSETEIVIVGHLPLDFGLLASTASLEGDDMVRQMRGQLGEMLIRLPGVSATSFAPGASRPVLRGFDGDRIRVLVDGIGTVDASNVSADHAVVFDPLTVDHIDVVHGPAVLLFGGQAIGGAVNAIDRRIPRSVPDSATVTVLGSLGTAARERSAGGAAQVRLADRLALHVDASWRKSGDLRTGGLINSPELRAELLAQAEIHASAGDAAEAGELVQLAGLSGRIPDTASRSGTLGAGLAFIDAEGSLGISIQRHDSRYGVPLRPGGNHDHAGPDQEEGHGDENHGGQAVNIDLRQTRIDLRGVVKMSGFFESMQIRGAYGDYHHTELEGGAKGTVFAGKGHELRIDLVQAEKDGWRGRSGIQLQGRKLAITGPEAFTPDNETSRYGIFTLQSVELGSGLEAELAGRHERARIQANSIGYDRSFDLWSGALGLSWQPYEGWKLGANVIRGARAPAPEELLSDGKHVATQAHEVGNPSFGQEKSTAFEAYLRYAGDSVGFSLTTYSTHFRGFISALPTGVEEDGMPVFRYAQYPARFRGFESEARVRAMTWQGGALTMKAAADYTRAQIRGVGPVPRIPPLRMRGGLELELGDLHVDGEMEWNAAQAQVARFENPVPGFMLVNLSADWHPMGDDGPLTLILSVDNLFDVTGRRAASYTRDFVPVSGRDIRLTARISF